jgi:basic membrane lipoprotein Med (substrate-binding protein (PBP1-ABC) superfamily)
MRRLEVGISRMAMIIVIIAVIIIAAAAGYLVFLQRAASGPATPREVMQTVRITQTTQTTPAGQTAPAAQKIKIAIVSDIGGRGDLSSTIWHSRAEMMRKGILG